MRLTVVGCAGSFPGPDSPCSCYLVEADGFRLLLDLGNGALGALQRHVDLYAVDAVLLSHLHPDHCLDLCSYYVARKYAPAGAPPPTPVYGPAGTADRMARAYDPAPEPSMRGIFDFRTLASGRLEVGPFELTVDHMNHPVETFGVRLEQGGRALAYSADTGETDAVARLAADADLLVCEASYLGEKEPDDHLTARLAGEYAARAGAGRLLLTHLVPWNDPDQTSEEAAGAYGGAMALARSGVTYELI